MSNKIKRVKLRDIVPESEVVLIGEQDGEEVGLELYGIGLADITRLFRRHTAAAEQVFKDFTEQRKDGKELTVDGVTVLFEQVLDRAPELVYDLIAAAARDIDARDHVANLRAPIQLELLKAVIKLSIKSEAELKKLAADLIGQVRHLTEAAANLGLKRLSESGSGASANA